MSADGLLFTLGDGPVRSLTGEYHRGRAVPGARYGQVHFDVGCYQLLRRKRRQNQNRGRCVTLV